MDFSNLFSMFGGNKSSEKTDNNSEYINPSIKNFPSEALDGNVTEQQQGAGKSSPQASNPLASLMPLLNGKSLGQSNPLLNMLGSGGSNPLGSLFGNKKDVNGNKPNTSPINVQTVEELKNANDINL